SRGAGPLSMTMTEQVLARHAGRKTVAPGDNIWVDVDILMTHDVCGPGTIGIFRKQFGPNAKVWDREKVVIIPDHYIFTNDHHAARRRLGERAADQAVPGRRTASALPGCQGSAPAHHRRHWR